MERSLAVILLLPVPAAWFRVLANDSKIVTPDVHGVHSGVIVLAGQTTEFFSGNFLPPSELADSIIDGLHRLPEPGQWLFSTDTFQDNLPGLSMGAQSGHVIRYDGAGNYSYFFCGTTADLQPAAPNIDALFLDRGQLIVSFETATAVAGTDYPRNDLLKFSRLDENCSSWQFDGPVFQGLDKIEAGSKIIGAVSVNDGFVFAFDRVTCTCPPGCPVPQCWDIGQLVKWNGTTFSEFDNLSDWEAGALIMGLSLQPETCPDLNGASPSDGEVDSCAASWRTDDGTVHYRLEWRPEDNAQAYNVYRGLLSELATLDPPALAPECRTDGGLQNIQFVLNDSEFPPQGDGFYYLVSAVIGGSEGSLGENGMGIRRVISNPCLP
jgi:hypothetical protein